MLLYVNAPILIFSLILLYILLSLHLAFSTIWFHILHIIIPICLLGPAATSVHCHIFVLSKPKTPWQGKVML